MKEKKKTKSCNSNPIFCTSHWTNSGTKGLQHGIEAGLLLCQANIPKKHYAQETKNSHIKQCISWGLVVDGILYSVMTMPLLDTWTCRKYTYCIYSITYIHFYAVYIHFYMVYIHFYTIY
jgi:hypothetical protein